ncbi:CDP-diacylglycerol--serine O-phosphatidyltransferase [bacterium]|nr:CDP-diacylglycerol--serine O-phosphatidyltransferase [bacterium]
MKIHKRLKKTDPRKLVPNAFTLGNLFCGFWAIIFAANGYFHKLQNTETSNDDFNKASLLILAAMFFDALDGKLARHLGTESEFGIEFDSLADMTSFCLAPSLLIYFRFFGENTFLALAVSSLPVLLGAVRLARFNVMANQVNAPILQGYFTGLPTPASAFVIASLVLFQDGIHVPNYLIYAIIVLISFLMVSNIPYYKISNTRMPKNLRSGLFVGSIVSGFLLAWIFFSFSRAAFPFALLYIIWAIISYFAKKIPALISPNDDVQEEEISQVKS